MNIHIPLHEDKRWAAVQTPIYDWNISTQRMVGPGGIPFNWIFPLISSFLRGDDRDRQANNAP